MQSKQERYVVELILWHKRTISFPQGLRAFTSVKDFILYANEGESPLFWLEAKTYKNLAFILVDPYLIYPDYRPELAQEDMEALEIGSLNECLVLCFAYTRNMADQGVTVNLGSPVAINWKTGKARQVDLLNRKNYPIDYVATSRSQEIAA